MFDPKFSEVPLYIRGEKKIIALSKGKLQSLGKIMLLHVNILTITDSFWRKQLEI